MGEGTRLGALGRRLFGALMLTAVTAIAVMLLGMVVTEARVQAALAADTRRDLASALAATVAADYDSAGSWDGLALDVEGAGGDPAAVHVILKDASGAIVLGGPVGPNFDRRAVSAPVVVNGKPVGTVLVEVRPESGAEVIERLSKRWFLASTVVALLVGAALAYILAKRMTRPIDGYIATARAFAAGDHSARPSDLGPPELRDLTQALTAAADEIERSEAERRRLTSDITHELRTPLAALQAGLEELRDGLAPADPATLAALHDQASRLGRIVSDLSGLAQAESHALELHREAMDLGEAVEMAAAAWRGTLQASGLSVEFDLSRGVEVVADRDRLHQILDNLLANAAAYCRPGDSVRVAVAAGGAEGLLQVVDTGPGFRAEDLPFVFERAWRGANAAGTQGSGLGLPIVRALAEAQGGSVQVESVAGRGATITVRLPMA